MSSKRIQGPIWIISGTRPEVIKLAPVLNQARSQFGAQNVHWISTHQHLQLESDTLARFGITATHRLAERTGGGSITDFNLSTIAQLTALQERTRPSLVIVQGDTASTFAGAFAAFHAGIPIAHVEAGLRTDDIHDPFPEEAYRRMIDAVSDLHFAPTMMAAERLISEGYSAGTVFSTGNTAVDALQMIDHMDIGAAAAELPDIPDGARLLFVTAHRRESWGRPLEQLCMAIRDIVETFNDVHVVLPVHVNPIVRDTVRRVLKDVPRVTLTHPLDFAACHFLIRRSHLILTDSGGIAEEAPSYGVPTLILRNATERPESVDAGLAQLVGTDRNTVLAAASAILRNPALHTAMKASHNPYGDGRASERIVLGIERFLAQQLPVLSADEQFRETGVVKFPAPTRLSDAS